LRLTAIVLPVVRIDASLAIVVVFAVRTPDRFEVEEVKVHVYRVLLDQLHRDLALTVREGAILFVVADILRPRAQIRRAELCLVLIRMVKFFNSVMGAFTGVAVRTMRRTGVALLTVLAPC